MENRIKEQFALFADRVGAATNSAADSILAAGPSYFDNSLLLLTTQRDRLPSFHTIECFRQSPAPCPRPIRR